MICVFDVIEGPARGKRFWLRQDERVEIGRISTADFSIPADQHMSRHHLIVEATVESFRVRDVGSANGTFVNNAKVTALDLCSGDKIRAGSSTFKVSLIADNVSPHAADGLSLDSSFANPRSSSGFEASSSIAAPQRSVQMPAPISALKIVQPEVAASPSDDEDTQKLYSVSSILDSVAKRSNGSGPASSHTEADDCSTEMQSATWIADYFVPTKVPQLFEQTRHFDDEFDLVDLLRFLDGEYRLSVILNTNHLGHFAQEVVEESRKLSRVMELSPKLCLLSSDGSHEFWSMIRDSLRREALIVFGSFEPLTQEWLTHIADLLISPSMLNELLIGSTEPLRAELLEQAAFVLFERDHHGLLSLLARAH